LDRDTQSTAPVDVFFVHATTAFEGLGNAALDEAPGCGLPVDFTDKHVGRYASAFNGSCRIYAPKYRQARCNNYHILSGSRGEADELLPVYGYKEKHVGADAFKLALADVTGAFNCYMALWNSGRRFVLAGHSQGSAHLVHIIQWLEKHQPEVLERCVCCYLPGCQIGVKSFTTLKPAYGPTDHGLVYLSWCTVAKGITRTMATGRHRPGYADGTVTMVEGDVPISVAPEGATGAAMWSDKNGLHPGAYSTLGATEEGLLQVELSPQCQSMGKGISRPGDYHTLDVVLFWNDIRQDVARRVAAGRGRE